MTREEKLYTMRGAELIQVAENAGVKVNHKGTQLKESKAKVIAKILAVENAETAPAEVKGYRPRTAGEPVEREPQKVVRFRAKKTRKTYKPRQKKALNEAVAELLTYICTEWEKMGGTVKPCGNKFRPLCSENGRQVIKLMWTTKKISFFVRVEAATAHAEQWQKINYAMPFQCMFFNDTEETRQNIKDIFQLVLDVDSVRPKKTKKTA